MSHVFISYSTRDAGYANRLADKLRAEGFKVWIDNTRLRSGEDWWRAIVLAIDTCAAFVVLLSPQSDRSKWVQREITLADQRDKIIFPLLLAGDINTPNWSLFVRTQYDDLRDGRLPDAGFYDKLAQYSPRQPGQGEDITDPHLPRPQHVMDPVLQAAMADPPILEGTPQRLRLSWLLTAVLVIVIVAAAVPLLQIPLPDPPSADQIYLQGIQAADQGDHVEAISAFTQAINSGFTSLAEAYTMRGDMHRFENDAVAALRDYDAALAEDPGFFGAYMGRGLIFKGESQFDLAIDNFQLALDNADNNETRAEALEELGWTFHYKGDYDRAVEQFTSALELRFRPEDRAGDHYGLGLSFLRMDDLAEAIRNLEEATVLDPGFPEAFRELGSAHDAAGSPDLALVAYHKYADLQGDQVEDWVLQRIAALE